MPAAFTVLWRLRLQVRPVGWIFGVYLVCAGIERFIIEIFRAKDDRLFGPLTIAQLVSIVLCVGGALILGTFRKDDDLAPGPYLRQTPS